MVAARLPKIEGPLTLVTGASGFLGQHFMKEARESSENFLCVTRSASVPESENVKAIDSHTYEAIFDSLNVEKIVHLATEYGRQQSATLKVVSTNLELPLRLIENHNGTLKHFINVDSYFTKPKVIQNYLWEYSLSKRQLTEWLERLSINFATSNVVLEHIYGPGDSPEKFVPWLTKSMLESRDIDLSDGRQLRDWIYITDAAKALMVVHAQPLASLDQGLNRFEVGCGSNLSLRCFVETVMKISGSCSKLSFDSSKNRPNEPATSVADITKLTELGWKPQQSLESGIAALIEYQRNIKE